MNEVLRLRSHDKIGRYDPRPFLDLTLGFGAASGGAQVGEIGGGDGWSLNVGAMLTPLWVDDRAGFGAGIELGLKRGTPDHYTITDVSLRRYPVDATFHAAIRIAGRWFVMLAGGLTKDFGVSLTNYAGALSSELGFLGRLAIYYRIADSSALLLGVQKTDLSYTASDGTTFDAGSRSLFGAVSFAR